MRQAGLEVTPERGYARPQPLDASSRRSDAAPGCAPYERSYELRRGYELPGEAVRSLGELPPERPC